MKNINFLPWVGSCYEQGISGKRVIFGIILKGNLIDWY